MTDKPIVYLLDDEPSMLRALSRVLRARGFEVVTFDKQADFFEHKRTTGLACLVLDLAMPGLNGLEVQQLLAEKHDGIPVVFLTGHGDIPTSVRAIKAGANDFLIKPVSGDDLVAAVDSALNRAKIQQAENTELAELRRRLEQLTPRQREVFEYVIAGKLNKTIAADLGTGEQTIKVHRRRVMRKLGVKSLADLVRTAERLGIKPVC
jgi:FixJ family two-component response regulator